MKTLISDRWDIMESLVRGRRVLDLGCVDHDGGREAGEHWLHAKICSAAKEVLGVDYLEGEVRSLCERGYKAVQGNVEDLNLGRRFEVITAGNIIEHLSNPGLFLDSVKRHLQDDGLFLLTTDNCYGLRSLKGIFLHDEIFPNAEHAMTFEEKVLRHLLERHGFHIRSFYFYNGPYASLLKKKFIDILCRFRKSWAWQMLVVAELKKQDHAG